MEEDIGVIVNGTSQDLIEFAIQLNSFFSQFSTRLSSYQDLVQQAAVPADALLIALNQLEDSLGEQQSAMSVTIRAMSLFYRTFILPFTLEGELLQFDTDTIISAKTLTASSTVELQSIDALLTFMLSSAIEIQVCYAMPFQHLFDFDAMHCLPESYRHRPRSGLVSRESHEDFQDWTNEHTGKEGGIFATICSFVSVCLKGHGQIKNVNSDVYACTIESIVVHL